MTTTGKISVRTLRNQLKQRSQNDLIEELVLLFSRFDDVRNYYQFQLSGEPDEDVVAKYKAAIAEEFSTHGRPGEGRLSVARRVVNQYKKVAPSERSLIDLMLFYVEAGVKYTNAFGDIDEPFYNSMESMYERTLETIVKHELQAEFEHRCMKIVTDTSGIGWGFHDELNMLYSQTFNKH